MSTDLEKKENKEFVEKERLPKKLEKDGKLGYHSHESVPTFKKLESETVIDNKNSFIVLGRDRNASQLSGKAGKGDTHASSIDLVVGRHSAQPGKNPDADKSVDTNFFTDSARIYISQKSDVDTYFGLAKGSEAGNTSNDRAGIGIKADHVRIVGRNHIKLVTGKAKMNQVGKTGEKNGQGGEIETSTRIDFIAGNNTDDLNINSFIPGFGKRIKKLQPLVKGDNMVEFCNEVLDLITDVLSYTLGNTQDIATLYTLMSSHFHPVVSAIPGVAIPAVATIPTTVAKTIVASKRMASEMSTAKSIGIIELNYLKKEGSPTYINSKFVNTT